MKRQAPVESVEETTSHQMALALFDELLPMGVTIAESPSEIGFRRHKILVDIVELGLVSRRALDAAFFIVAQQAQIQSKYDVELSYFKWLMTYNSNNRRHLRSVFRDLQKSAIEGESGSELENWGSIPLMGKVAINGGRLLFEMDAKLQQLIKDPQQAPFLSLRVSNVFTSNYARALYDHLLNYCDIGETEWLDLETTRVWTDADTKAFHEFKYLKRTVLDPAVRQINEVSNLNVSYRTNNVPGSKKVGAVRFNVERKTENPLLTSKLGLAELYETLRNEFGLSPQNFDEIMENRENWTDDWINEAVEFTRFSIKRKKVKHSVSGFLMHALRNNLRVGTADIEVAAQLENPNPKPGITPLPGMQKDERTEQIVAVHSAQIEDEISTSVTAGLQAFDSLDKAGRTKYLGDFKRTLQAKSTCRKEGIAPSDLTEELVRSNKLLAQAFGQYVYGKVAKAA